MCEKCGTTIGYFRSLEDHGGVIAVCPGCKKDKEIENNILQEVEDSPMIMASQS